MSSTFHLLSVALATTTAGVVMVRLAVRSRLLNDRVERRRCTSCGRLIETPVCPSCARR